MGAHCHIKTNKTYDFKYDPKQYMVDAFNAIGWPDPFPRPVLTGKFHKPNLSSEKTNEYRKWAKEENIAILKEDNYIFESVGVIPAEVTEENNRELALQQARRKKNVILRGAQSVSPPAKKATVKEKGAPKKSTKKKKGSKKEKSASVEKTPASQTPNTNDAMSPRNEEAEPEEDDGVERVNLVYLSKRYHGN